MQEAGLQRHGDGQRHHRNCDYSTAMGDDTTASGDYSTARVAQYLILIRYSTNSTNTVLYSTCKSKRVLSDDKKAKLKV